MLIILPVKSLFLYAAMGLSTYSFVSFAATATPTEVQLLCTILNTVTTGLGLYAAFHITQRIIKRLDALDDAIRKVEEEDSALHVTFDTDELQEIAATPTEPTPTEETAEFADLLAEKKEN